MLRRLHSFAGLALALMLVAIAATGVGLSLKPAVDRLAAPAIAPGVSVAALTEAVAARHQRVDAIRVRGDGAVTVSFNDGAGKQVEMRRSAHRRRGSAPIARPKRSAGWPMRTARC